MYLEEAALGGEVKGVGKLSFIMSILFTTDYYIRLYQIGSKFYNQFQSYTRKEKKVYVQMTGHPERPHADDKRRVE